ncbi:uncharacterized protein ACNLHF_000507 [Anomaloglossus baeobatrachus]
MNGKWKMPPSILILLVISHRSGGQYFAEDEDLPSVSPAGDPTLLCTTITPPNVSSDHGSQTGSFNSSNERENGSYTTVMSANVSSRRQEGKSAELSPSGSALSLYVLNVWLLILSTILHPLMLFVMFTIIYYFYESKKKANKDEECALFDVKSSP